MEARWNLADGLRVYDSPRAEAVAFVMGRNRSKAAAMMCRSSWCYTCAHCSIDGLN